MSAELSSALAASGHLAESGEGDYALQGFPPVHVCEASAIPSVGAIFREAGCFLEMLTAVDHRFEDVGCFRLVYVFNQLEEANRHRIHVDLGGAEAAPSLVESFPAADWMEREVYDMYGITFEGTPTCAAFSCRKTLISSRCARTSVRWIPPRKRTKTTREATNDLPATGIVDRR